MAQLNDLLKKLRHTNRNQQCVVLRDISASIQYAKKKDLEELLYMLQTAHDMELQVKIFSILSAYLVSNGTHADLITKYNPIYCKVHNVLSKGLPQKTTMTLNFVSTLLYLDEDADIGKSRYKLVIYARNMVRSSGCLAAMCKLFVTTTMHHESWRALCRSIGDACRECEDNQNYCSHLVPLCLQTCSTVNLEVITLLQNLLHQNNRNIQLFIDSDGILIFNRDSLQYEAGMQLLSTVVQNSTTIAIKIQETNVLSNLYNILHSHGPYSQMGQWVTIILYHIHLQTKGTETNRSRLEAPKDAETTENHMIPEQLVDNFNIKEDDDTVNLFKNIVNEINQCESKYRFAYKEPHLNVAKLNNKNTFPYLPQLLKQYATTFKNNPPTDINMDRDTEINNKRKSLNSNLSFSFLLKQNVRYHNENQKNDSSKYLDFIINGNNNKVKKHLKNNNFQSNKTFKNNGDTTSNISTIADQHCENTPEDLNNFQPAFASTPKRRRRRTISIRESSLRPKLTSLSLTRSTDKTMRKERKGRKIFKETKHKRKVAKDIKNKSMSARLLNVINDSCTTLVKTFKNIFKSNSSNLDKKTITSENSSNYSFTKYMMRRDAVLASNSTKNYSLYHEYYNNEVNSCETCNNTLVLKRKLSKDEHLKGTIKKLKIGINLYGCDFKKISAALWPRDACMTPVVLYNLYRKLIVK